MKILVTGFDPFGSDTINPSEEVIKCLPKFLGEAGEIEVIPLVIPTVVEKSLRVIREAIVAHSPAAVLSIGQAGGRTDITMERVGINTCDFRIPDNEGNQPVDTPAVADSPDAYLTTLPNKAVIRSLWDAGIPASLSNSAGTFVCNYICFAVADLVKREFPGVLSGFMHIPYLPEQVAEMQRSGRGGAASMSMDTLRKAVCVAVETIGREIAAEADCGMNSGGSSQRGESKKDGEVREIPMGTTH